MCSVRILYLKLNINETNLSQTHAHEQGGHLDAWYGSWEHMVLLVPLAHVREKKSVGRRYIHMCFKVISALSAF